MAMLNNQMVRSLFFFKQALWDAQHMRKGWWKGERKDWTKCPKVPVIEENVVCGCLISGLFWSPKVVSIIICCFGLTFASELIKHEYHDQSCPTTTHILPDKKKQWSPWKLQSFGFFLGMTHCYPNHISISPALSNSPWQPASTTNGFSISGRLVGLGGVAPKWGYPNILQLFVWETWETWWWFWHNHGMYVFFPNLWDNPIQTANYLFALN